MNDKLIYTFFGYNKHTSKLLYDTELIGWDKVYINRNNSLKKIIDNLDKYKLVIGIADHRKNIKKNRFDNKYINRYGNRVILNNGLDMYMSNIDVKESSDLYIYTSISNGPCNRSSYLIMNNIFNRGLDIKFGFFHLKKDITSNQLLNILNGIKI